MWVKSGHLFVALASSTEMLVGFVGLLFLVREQFQGRVGIATAIRAIRRKLASANVEKAADI